MLNVIKLQQISLKGDEKLNIYTNNHKTKTNVYRKLLIQSELKDNISISSNLSHTSSQTFIGNAHYHLKTNRVSFEASKSVAAQLRGGFYFLIIKHKNGNFPCKFRSYSWEETYECEPEKILKSNDFFPYLVYLQLWETKPNGSQLVNSVIIFNEEYDTFALYATIATVFLLILICVPIGLFISYLTNRRCQSRIPPAIHLYHSPPNSPLYSPVYQPSPYRLSSTPTYPPHLPPSTSPSDSPSQTLSKFSPQNIAPLLKISPKNLSKNGQQSPNRSSSDNSPSVSTMSTLPIKVSPPKSTHYKVSIEGAPPISVDDKTSQLNSLSKDKSLKSISKSASTKSDPKSSPPESNK